MNTIRTLFTIMALSILPQLVVAQEVQVQERAFNYLQAIMSYHEQVGAASVSFFRCAVHCQEPTQVESHRRELEGILTSAVSSMKQIPDFDGDASLRTESTTILNSQLEACKKDYLELNQNYAGANSTADAIEAYYRLLEEAEKQQAEETARFEVAYRAFAARHNIQLLENTGVSEIEKANEVNAYYRSLNMPTLPLQGAMARAIEAVQTSSPEKLEEARLALAEAVKKADVTVNQLSAFGDDDSFRQSTLSYIGITEEVANTYFPAMIKYLKSQNGDDLPAYNAAVAFFNTHLNSAIEKLNIAQNTFLKKHVPKPGKGQKRI